MLGWKIEDDCCLNGTSMSVKIIANNIYKAYVGTTWGHLDQNVGFIEAGKAYEGLKEFTQAINEFNFRLTLNY